MKEVVKLISIDQIKAYSDPYRLKIISFFKNTREAATVKEVADYLEDVPAKVHYHIKKLERAGILELIRTKEIKGIIAKYYYLTAESFIIESEEINQHTKKVYNSQILNIVNEYYDKSKEKSMNTLIKKEEQNAISIIFKDICISNELCSEFDIEMRALIKKYEILSKTSSENKCHIFSGCLNESE